MPRDKTATHIKVLAAAREEFMEYGYENASMRRIGQRCDMTAAGLYRHCKDKAGLFGELVSPSIEKIDAWLEAHITRSMKTMESDTIDLWKDSEIDMMRDLIYPNMEEYRLLLAILSDIIAYADGDDNLVRGVLKHMTMVKEERKAC